MKLMGLVAMVASGLMGLVVSAASAPGQWEQPAAALAEQIAGILGPGQAHLTIRNLSTIPTDQIPTIRRLLEQDLKTRGVTASGAESANTIRVTLSENARERLCVAEVVEGNETRVAMVQMPLETTSPSPVKDHMVLRKERYLGPFELTSLPWYPLDEPLLAMVETHRGLVVLKQDKLLIFMKTTVGWDAVHGHDLEIRQPMPRDARGILVVAPDGDGFIAFTAGTKCTGSFIPPPGPDPPPGEGWSIQCHPSDDPWALPQSDAFEGPITIKAFYNAARNYFTGVVAPGVGVDLPPFYSAALRAGAGRDDLLLVGIDGKVQIAENGGLKPIAGTRDWGSDFAVLHSRCGSSTQIIASGSGEALHDSIRAYELPAYEAVQASDPLAMDGTVTALWTAQDFNGVFAVVRNAQNEYEVDRVTALCN